MPTLPNEALARDIIPAQTGNTSESTASGRRTIWRFWRGACFVILLLAAFGQPLLALANYAAGSQLYSYILLVPFVSAYLPQNLSLKPLTSCRSLSGYLMNMTGSRSQRPPRDHNARPTTRSQTWPAWSQIQRVFAGFPNLLIWKRRKAIMRRA